MHITFEKYHGTGNDFIMIDNRLQIIEPKNKVLIEKICNRHFGIGADGLIAIEKSEHFDFKMNYYNADGNVGSMCGNGGRCAVAFAKKLRILANNDVTFEAFDGKHKASILDFGIMGSANVALMMNDVKAGSKNENAYVLNTGSPHYVVFGNNIEEINVVERGREIRNSSAFLKEGINVNFVEINTDSLIVRTYERGVEGETLSCGTGVTASAIAASIEEQKTGNLIYKINTLGGELTVRFASTGIKFSDICLEGPATHVFTGIMEI